MKKKLCNNYEQRSVSDTICDNCGHSEQKHYPQITPRDCDDCGCRIPLARLECLPDTQYCIKCVGKNVPKVIHDPDKICAKASISCANGFAPDD